jgi:hypothetical protein
MPSDWMVGVMQPPRSGYTSLYMFMRRTAKCPLGPTIVGQASELAMKNRHARKLAPRTHAQIISLRRWHLENGALRGPRPAAGKEEPSSLCSRPRDPTQLPTAVACVSSWREPSALAGGDQEADLATPGNECSPCARARCRRRERERRLDDQPSGRDG